MNSETYLKWTFTVGPIFVLIVIGATYSSYKTLINAHPTGVIQLGTISSMLAGYTFLFVVLSVICLMSWLIFGLFLMFRKIYQKKTNQTVK